MELHQFSKNEYTANMAGNFAQQRVKRCARVRAWASPHLPPRVRSGKRRLPAGRYTPWQILGPPSVAGINK